MNTIKNFLMINPLGAIACWFHKSHQWISYSKMNGKKIITGQCCIRCGKLEVK